MMKGINMLSRKYYKMIAQCIKDSSTYDTYGDVIVHKEDLINELCVEFNLDNHLFSRSKFRDACD